MNNRTVSGEAMLFAQSPRGIYKVHKSAPGFRSKRSSQQGKKKGRSKWKSTQATLIQSTEWHVWLEQKANIFAHMQGNRHAYDALNMGPSYANKALRPT